MKPIDRIIAKLRRLDRDAADYVQQEYNAGHIGEESVINNPHAITYLFTWSDQPQGHRYWRDLHSRYMELPNLTPKGNQF